DLHGTSVVEQITFTDPVNGLPTKAHIHLPTLGGDNGIYSATIKFSWDKYKPPAKHFQIRLQNMLIKDNSDPTVPFTACTFSNAGEWNMWADVAGHWINLTQVNGQLYECHDDDTIDLTAAPVVDVYVNPGDPLYCAAFGYEADCLDTLFNDSYL